MHNSSWQLQDPPQGTQIRGTSKKAINEADAGNSLAMSDTRKGEKPDSASQNIKADKVKCSNLVKQTSTNTNTSHPTCDKVIQKEVHAPVLTQRDTDKDNSSSRKAYCDDVHVTATGNECAVQLADLAAMKDATVVKMSDSCAVHRDTIYRTDSNKAMHAGTRLRTPDGCSPAKCMASRKRNTPAEKDPALESRTVFSPHAMTSVNVSSDKGVIDTTAHADKPLKIMCFQEADGSIANQLNKSQDAIDSDAIPSPNGHLNNDGKGSTESKRKTSTWKTDIPEYGNKNGSATSYIKPLYPFRWAASNCSAEHKLHTRKRYYSSEIQRRLFSTCNKERETNTGQVMKSANNEAQMQVSEHTSNENVPNSIERGKGSEAIPNTDDSQLAATELCVTNKDGVTETAANEVTAQSEVGNICEGQQRDNSSPSIKSVWADATQRQHAHLNVRQDEESCKLNMNLVPLVTRGKESTKTSEIMHDAICDTDIRDKTIRVSNGQLDAAVQGCAPLQGTENYCSESEAREQCTQSQYMDVNAPRDNHNGEENKFDDLTEPRQDNSKEQRRLKHVVATSQYHMKTTEKSISATAEDHSLRATMPSSTRASANVHLEIYKEILEVEKPIIRYVQMKEYDTQTAPGLPPEAYRQSLRWNCPFIPATKIYKEELTMREKNIPDHTCQVQPTTTAIRKLSKEEMKHKSIEGNKRTIHLRSGNNYEGSRVDEARAEQELSQRSTHSQSAIRYAATRNSALPGEDTATTKHQGNERKADTRPHLSLRQTNKWERESDNSKLVNKSDGKKTQAMDIDLNATLSKSCQVVMLSTETSTNGQMNKSCQANMSDKEIHLATKMSAIGGTYSKSCQAAVSQGGIDLMAQRRGTGEMHKTVQAQSLHVVLESTTHISQPRRINVPWLSAATRRATDDCIGSQPDFEAIQSHTTVSSHMQKESGHLLKEYATNESLQQRGKHLPALRPAQVTLGQRHADVQHVHVTQIQASSDEAKHTDTVANAAENFKGRSKHSARSRSDADTLKTMKQIFKYQSHKEKRENARTEHDVQSKINDKERQRSCTDAEPPPRCTNDDSEDETHILVRCTRNRGEQSQHKKTRSFQSCYQVAENSQDGAKATTSEQFKG